MLPLVREAQKETLEETPIGQSMQAQKDAPIGQRSTKGDIEWNSHWSEFESAKGCSPLVREAQKETLEETPSGQSLQAQKDVPLVRKAQKETFEETPIGQSMQAQKDAPIGQRGKKDAPYWSEKHKKRHWRRLPLVRVCKCKRMFPLVREAQKETVPLTFSFAQLAKGKSLGRSKPATNSQAQSTRNTLCGIFYYIQDLQNCLL
jgi:hypothetical protein